MDVRYDVLDMETGNLFGRFSVEEDALEFVRALIDANGLDIVESVALGGRDDAGRVLPVQTGAALARRAQAATADRRPIVGRV